MLELLHAANGRPTSLYASEMGAPLYVQLGFKTVDVVVQFSCRRHCTLEIAAAAARAAGVVVTVTTAPTTADIMLVGELDSAMFGGDRMALLQSALGLGADATLAVARNASGEVVAFAASARPNAFSQGGHCTTYHTASIILRRAVLSTRSLPTRAESTVGNSVSCSTVLQVRDCTVLWLQSLRQALLQR